MLRRRVLQIVALVLLALLSAPAAPVSAARCPKLCRPMVTSCRGLCTEGTRKERRQCKRFCRTDLVGYCKASGSTTTCCGPSPLTCEQATDGVENFSPGVIVDGFPSDFPAAPADAVLCGSTQQSNGTLTVTVAFYTTAGSPDAVVSHYSSAATASGLGFEERPDAVGPIRALCDRGFQIARPGVDDEVGALIVLAQQGAFAVSWAVDAPQGPPVRR